MKIDKDTLDDARTLGRTDVLQTLFQKGKQVIERGKEIKIIQYYDNAPPEVVEIIRTLERLRELTIL